MAKAQLLPAYLIVGEDTLKAEEALRRLTDRVAQEGDLDFNREVFDGAQGAEGQAIVEAANTLPFLSDLRLVVVKIAEKLPKESSELLVSYLADPNPTTVMALIAGKLAKNTRLYKATAKVGPRSVIDCTPKKGKKLPQLVQKMAETHGASLDWQAAEQLVERVGTDTVQLDAEVKKLSDVVIARGGTAIGVDDVKHLVTRVADVKPWDLTAALAQRDAHRCALLISRIQDQSWPGLLSWCVSRIRELIVTKALEQRGEGYQLVEQIRKVNPRVQDWQLRDHRRWAARFTSRELRQALEDAAEAERQMKTGADAQTVFELWVLGVCRGTSAASR